MEQGIFSLGERVLKRKHGKYSHQNCLAPHTIGFNGWLTIEGGRKINVQCRGSLGRAEYWKEVIKGSTKMMNQRLQQATNLLQDERELAVRFPGLNCGGD